MSLEALSALKQLTEVKQSGFDVQNNNLEKVQGEVQNSGTSEASRVDNLSLEKIKTEYEGALHQAQVTRLQQQLEREAKAVVVGAVIAIGVVGLGALDLAWNTVKDLNDAKNNTGNFAGDGDQKNKVGDIKDPKNTEMFEAGDRNLVVGKDKDGNSVVYGAKKGENGEVTEVGAATITDSEVRDQMVKDGFIEKDDETGGFKLTEKGEKLKADKGIDLTDPKNQNFATLAKVDPSGANALFGAKEHDVLISEAHGMSAAFKGVGAKDDPDSMTQRVDDKLKADGKLISDGDKAKQVAKNFVNGFIQLAEAAVPFLQAYMAAKDKATNTAEELQMAVEKQAANMKKLKQLEDLMINAGSGGMGKI